MSENTRTAGPKLTADERQGIIDFHRVYDDAWREVQEELNLEVEKLPVIAQLIKSLDPTQMEAQNQQNRELLRGAVERDEWEPYLADLRRQGRLYADLGVDFRTWFELTGIFEKIVFPRLMTRYGQESDRLMRAVLGSRLFLELVLSTIGDEYLATKEDLIRQQQRALLELSTPVLKVRERMLILPIIGVLDTRRARQLTQQMLQAIREHRALMVIMDITGVPAVDSRVANHILQSVAAGKLMGAHVVVSGLSADVAQALVMLGVDLEKLTTVGDLQTAMETAEKRLGFRMVPNNGSA